MMIADGLDEIWGLDSDIDPCYARQARNRSVPLFMSFLDTIHEYNVYKT